jgi:hypothetical protein
MSSEFCTAKTVTPKLLEFPKDPTWHPISLLFSFVGPDSSPDAFRRIHASMPAYMRFLLPGLRVSCFPVYAFLAFSSF